MKTLKALKITSILNGVFCFFCVACVILLSINQYFSVNIINTLGVVATFGWMFNPTSIISFVICLALFLSEYHSSEARQVIGKKWIWIFIWPVITTLFYFTAMGFFIEITGA